MQILKLGVGVEHAVNENAIFEGANTIARISDCSLAQARNLMENLPGVLSKIWV